MSLNPAEELSVEDCHLYSSVPVSPVGAVILVNVTGVLPEQIVWAVAIVPPSDGLMQVGAGNSKAPMEGLVKLRVVPA